MSTRLTSPADYAALLDKYDTWMFDCDGVIWRGDHLIDGAAEALSILRKKGKSLVFVTNNATQSRKSYKVKFDQLGVEVHLDEIFGSAYAAAIYISMELNLPKDQKVYVIGQSGIEDELREQGISFLGGTDPADNKLGPFSPSDFTPDPNVSVVLCGLDMSINYTKLTKALYYLTHNPNCLFLATNDDSTIPMALGVLPGAGAITAPLVHVLGRQPLSIGKPAATMLACVKDKVPFDPARTLMVGDRLETDIAFGKNGGLSTLLVLTGISKEEDFAGPNPAVVPDYVTQSLGGFCKLA